MTLALLLIACHWIEPTTSSESALVGRVLAPGGFPASDVRVDGLEASDFTDEEGRFAVRYKSDSAYVTVQQEATWFRRNYREEDAGTVVDLQLPQLGLRRLQCELAAPCRARLSWELSDGLLAWVEVPCESGITVPLPGVPAGEPEARCMAGSVPVAARVLLRGDSVMLVSPPRAVRVSVVTPPEVRPQDCAVTVAGAPAKLDASGVFVGEGTDGAPVMVRCNGWPSVPATVAVGSGSVEVLWLGEGPTLDLPQAQTLTLVASDWSLTLASADGVFRLPPLSAGDYKVALDAPTALVGATLPEPQSDTLVLLEPVGVLRLTQDLFAGSVRISR